MITQQSVTQMLREATWPQHQQAEGSPLEKALGSGQVSREMFTSWLGQRYLMHSELEPMVRELRTEDARVAAIVGDGLFQCDNLAADLAHFGIDSEQLAPASATQRFADDIREIKQVRRVHLLGSYYVFEGSKNGSRFIARAIGKGLGLEPGPGLLYLDPHGNEQRTLWKQFKEAMDQAGFDGDESQGMVAAARLTFTRVHELDTELYQKKAPAHSA